MDKASKTEYFDTEELTVADVASAIENALTSAGFSGGVRPDATVTARASTADGIDQRVERPAASELGAAMVYDVDSVDVSRPLDGVEQIDALLTGQSARIRVKPHTPWWSEGPLAPYLEVRITAPSADIVTSLFKAVSATLQLERADLEADKKAMTASGPMAPALPQADVATQEVAASSVENSVGKIIAAVLALAAAFALGAVLF